MKKILVSTSNKQKVQTIKSIFAKDDIEIVSPKDLGLKLDVEENGATVEENAVIKAKALSEKVDMPVFAWDKSLFIQSFPENEQPGMFVRRPSDVSHELSDAEAVEYYSAKLMLYGNESPAFYISGIAIIDENKNVFTARFEEDPFIFTSEVKWEAVPRFTIFDQMRKDIKSGKYFCDMTGEEMILKDHKLSENIRNFVLKTLGHQMGE